MKKIIILTIATLLTGIVLSSALKKNEVVAKSINSAPLNIHENTISKATTSYDAVGHGD